MRRTLTISITLLILLVLSSCAAAIYSVGDRENPSERFLSIDDGLSFYKLQSGNKAFAANIYVDDSYPFSTVYGGHGGFCYAKESTDAAEECALKQCLKNVNGINQFGGYGSFYKDCVLIRVNNEYYYSSIEKFDEQTGNQTRTVKLNAYRYAEAEKQRIRQAELARFNAKVEAEKQQALKVQQARQAQYQAYIDGIKEICKSYGFTDSNAIAVCVQKEIQKNEQIRLQMNQQIAQQNRTNAQNRARAFSEIGKTLIESGQTKTNPQPQNVCIYECGSETIIVNEGMCPINMTYKGKQCRQQ